LNSEIGRAAGSGKTGEPNKQIAREQEELRRELGELRDEWYKKSGSLGEVGSLDAAGTEMKDAAGDLRRDEPREARPHGDLAAEALANAISEVEGKMAGLAAGMVDSLSAEAGGLASKQRELAEDTGKAKPGEGEPLKEEQDELNEQAKDLLEKIDQAARSLGNFNEMRPRIYSKGRGIHVRMVLSALVNEPRIHSFTKRSPKPSARKTRWPATWRSFRKNSKGWLTNFVT
jgi:chromosome segregation ATPase